MAGPSAQHHKIKTLPPLDFLDREYDPPALVPPAPRMTRANWQRPPATASSPSFNPAWLLMAFVLLVLANIASGLVMDAVHKQEIRGAVDELRQNFQHVPPAALALTILAGPP